MNDFVPGLINHFETIFNPAVLSAKAAEWMISLSVGILILVFFYIFWQGLRRMFRHIIDRRNLDKTSAALIETILKYTVFIIGLVSALSSMGIQMTGVLASFGIAGLTVGFAARDALSNLISGILIFIDRPFVIGDLVEIEGIYGLVDKITLRSTRVITMDGRMMAVPNTEVINKTVASYTNFPHLRLDIPFTIGVNEDIGRVRQLVLGLVAKAEGYLEQPVARVIVTELNDYNIALQLQVWLDDERKHVEKRAELREKIVRTLSGAGVEMPFQTFSITPLTLKSDHQSS